MTHAPNAANQAELTFPDGTPSTVRDTLLAEARMLDESHVALQELMERMTGELANNRCAAFAGFDPLERAEGLYRVPARLFARVVARVSQALSPSETPLKLDVDHLEEHYFPRRAWSEAPAFSCVDLVERLLAEFAPCAHEIAQKQAAHKFARVFGLRYQKAPEVVSGRIVLKHGASVDTLWSTTRYSFHAQHNIREHLDALATCLPLANPAVDEESIRQSVRDVLGDLERRNWQPGRDYRGEVAGVQIRLFQTAVKYHFPAAHVQALNLFCVEHAPEYFAER